MTERVTARYDERFVWKARTVIAALVLLAVIVVISMVWAFQPVLSSIFPNQDEIMLNENVHPRNELGLPLVISGKTISFQFEIYPEGRSLVMEQQMIYISPVEQFETASPEKEVASLGLSPITFIGKNLEPCFVVNEPLRLPSEVDPGLYKYALSSCYRMNPIKIHCEELKSEPFLVRGSD